MRPVEPVRVAGALVDIAVPAPSSHRRGVSMAGFRGRAEGAVELRMVPYPALTMFLDFGDSLLVDEIGGRQQGGGVVVGLAPGSIRGSGRTVDLLQIRLSPVVAHGILGAGSPLGGTVVALEDLWGREAGRMHEKLHAAESWEARFAIARDALARRQDAGRAVHPEVAYAWRRVVSSRGRIRVERLAEETGWSRQRLWSRFRSQLGLTPKRAARLVRFDHAARRLARGHGAAAVAAECGYADQPHLHREVVSFAGMTPTAVAAAPWLTVDPIAWETPHQALRG
ncbi:helix-turn-helix transcriptional regulator [Nocardia wallacei]|uniref:helix-turn-helix transcriptional regulator n=1 Tax=Nocardia wallacei TaxID=480035 RepID=UPI002457BC9E|nr:helix-turn-helix transcriptional regulator [Nocardia wallacei]